LFFFNLKLSQKDLKGKQERQIQASNNKKERKKEMKV